MLWSVCPGITTQQLSVWGVTEEGGRDLRSGINVMFVSPSVPVFGAVRPGPADEDRDVSVLHRTAVQRVPRISPPRHDAAVWEQMWRHPNLPRRR